MSPKPVSGYAYTLSHGDAARSGSWSKPSNNDDWDSVMISPRHTSHYMWVGRRNIDGVEVNVWDDAHGRRYIAQTTVMTGHLQENQAGSLLIPLLIGGLVVGGVLWWATSKKSEEKATGPLPPPPAPVPASCDVDPTKLLQWGQSLGIAALYAPGVSFSCVMMPGASTPSCPNAAEVKNVLPADLQQQLATLPSNTAVLLATKGKGYWEFWYWAKDTALGTLRQDLYESYCSNFGTLAGHPADLFAVW